MPLVPGSRAVRHTRVLRWAVGGAAILLIVCWAVAPYWSLSPLSASKDILVAVAFAAAGAALYSQPQQRANARLFWLITALYVAASAGGHNLGPLPLIEYLATPLVFLPLWVILLRYPEPRLQRSYERWYVIIAALTVLTIRLVEVALSRPEWPGYGPSVWWPTAAASSAGWTLAADVLNVVETLLAVAFAPLIIIRLRRATGIDRRVLWPVVVAAVATGLLFTLEALVRFSQDLEAILVATVLQGAALFMIPVAFLAAAIQRRLSHAAVSDLVRTLARPVTIDRIRSALQTSLNDPSLQVAYWLPEQSGYFDTDGRPFDPLTVPVGRMAAAVTGADGDPLAVVTVDGSMRRYPALLDATLGAAALALENGRLQAKVRAQVGEVQESRARLVQAADAARQRIERDLHDGAQQRLVALKVALAVARAQAQSLTEITLIDRTQSEIQGAIEELRALARGIYPAVLTEAGLASAISNLVERLPLTVEVDVPPERYEPSIEAAAYFVTCESLANTIKHSAAKHAIVVVTQDADELVLQVVDDGVGGAELKPGGGLSGLRDRVSAVGGTLEVISPPNRGTEITARFSAM
jgi:signal transduction histidine kinase